MYFMGPPWSMEPLRRTGPSEIDSRREKVIAGCLGAQSERRYAAKAGWSKGAPAPAVGKLAYHYLYAWSIYTTGGQSLGSRGPDTERQDQRGNRESDRDGRGASRRLG